MGRSIFITMSGFLISVLIFLPIYALGARQPTVGVPMVPIEILSKGRPASAYYKVSNASVAAYSPSVATDTHGGVHVVWLDEGGLHYTMKQGDSFGISTLVWNVTPEMLNGTYPLSHARIHVDELETVHVMVIFKNFTDADQQRELWYFVRLANASAFTQTLIDTDIVRASHMREHYAFHSQNNVSAFSYVKYEPLFIHHVVAFFNLTSMSLSRITLQTTDMFTYAERGSPSETWLRSGPGLAEMTCFYIKTKPEFPNTLAGATLGLAGAMHASFEILALYSEGQVWDPLMTSTGVVYFGVGTSLLSTSGVQIYRWQPPNNLTFLRECKDTRGEIGTNDVRLAWDAPDTIHVLYSTWQVLSLPTLIYGTYLEYNRYSIESDSWWIPRILLFQGAEDPRQVQISAYNGSFHIVWQAGDRFEPAVFLEGYQIYYSNSSYLLSKTDFGFDLLPFPYTLQEFVQFLAIFLVGLVGVYFIQRYWRRRQASKGFRRNTRWFQPTPNRALAR